MENNTTEGVVTTPPASADKVSLTANTQTVDANAERDRLAAAAATAKLRRLESRAARIKEVCNARADSLRDEIASCIVISPADDSYWRLEDAYLNACAAAEARGIPFSSVVALLSADQRQRLQHELFRAGRLSLVLHSRGSYISERLECLR
jgi:hypothetical protein